MAHQHAPKFCMFMSFEKAGGPHKEAMGNQLSCIDAKGGELINETELLNFLCLFLLGLLPVSEHTTCKVPVLFMLFVPLATSAESAEPSAKLGERPWSLSYASAHDCTAIKNKC